MSLEPEFRIDSMDFDEALYRLVCRVCHEKVSWEAQFDADGTTYYGTCACKGFHWHMANETVKVERWRS